MIYDINSVFAYWAKWKGNTTINEWRFSLRDSSDEDFVFAKFVVEWISAIRNNAESRLVQNITIIAVAVELMNNQVQFVVLSPA